MALTLPTLPQPFTSLIEQISNAEERSVLQHAILFYGPKEAGKKILTQHILSCLSDVALEQNPDILEYDASLHNGIDDVRHFISWFAATPLVHKKKYGALYAVDALSTQAANALLKTLEEPPFDSRIFLTTHSLSTIPKTIVSRCACVYVSPLSKKDFLNYFSSRKLSQADSERLYDESDGKFGRAVLLLDTNSDTQERLRLYANEIIALLKGTKTIFDITSQWDKKTAMSDFPERREIWIQTMRRMIHTIPPSQRMRTVQYIQGLLGIPTSLSVQLSLQIENIWIQ